MSGYLFQGSLTVLALHIDIIVVDGLDVSHALNGVQDVILLSLNGLRVEHAVQVVWVLLVIVRRVVEAVVFVQVFCFLSGDCLVVVTFVLEHVQGSYISHQNNSSLKV
jgi:hypothetical protein